MKNKNFNLGLEYKISYFLYFFRKKNIKTNTVGNSEIKKKNTLECILYKKKLGWRFA